MHPEYIILGNCNVFALNMPKYLNEIDLHMDGAYMRIGSVRHPCNTSYLVFALRASDGCLQCVYVMWFRSYT